MKNYERSEIIPMTEEQKKAFELQIKKLDRRIEIMDKIKETILGIICTPLGIFSKIILILSLISIRVTAIGMFYGIYKSYKVYVDLKNGIPFFESQNLGIAILFLLLPFIMGIISYILSLLTDFFKFHSF